MIPKPLTNFSWFDQECEDVIIAVTDKTTMTFNLEEFSELYKIISDTRDNLLKLPEISIGSYEKNGEEFDELIYIPDVEDYN
jgi:hypothetical protein